MLDWCDIIFHENALHLDPTSNLLSWPDFYQYPFPYLFVEKSLEVGACCSGKVAASGETNRFDPSPCEVPTAMIEGVYEITFEYVWTDPTFCSYRSQTYQTIILRPNKLQTASMHWRASSERGWYKQLWIFYNQTLFLSSRQFKGRLPTEEFLIVFCKVSGQTVALVPFLDTISCFALTHQPIVQLPIDREAVLLVELNIYRFKKGAAVIPIASDSHRCAGNAVSWVCMPLQWVHETFLTSLRLAGYWINPGW